MIRVILVRPRYSLNVGLCVRAMKNFGFKDLAFVGRAKKTFTANKFAKHSKEVLRNAPTYRTLEEASAGFDMLVGTTGVLNRFRRSLKTCISLDELPSRIKSRSAAIAFGSEDTGLSESELNKCDLVVHVPTSDEHPVLNLSHAVAVTLYALGKAGKKPLYTAAPAATRDMLEEKFAKLVGLSEKVRNKRKVAIAFRRLLSRSMPSEDEAQALLAALSGFEHEMNQKQRQAH